jgi:hypothetical protein
MAAFWDGAESSLEVEVRTASIIKAITLTVEAVIFTLAAVRT